MERSSSSYNGTSSLNIAGARSESSKSTVLEISGKYVICPQWHNLRPLLTPYLTAQLFLFDKHKQRYKSERERSLLFCRKTQTKLSCRKRTMAEEGQVISCYTVEAWTEQLQKGNDSKKLVFFYVFFFFFFPGVKLIFSFVFG